jgi:HEAT repeat protein
MSEPSPHPELSTTMWAALPQSTRMWLLRRAAFAAACASRNLPALITYLKDPDYRVRYRAAATLGDIRDPHAIPALLEAIGDHDARDESSRVNTCASEALAKIGAPALALLLAALHARPDHPDDQWRRYWVVDALGLLGNPQSVEPLIALLDDAVMREAAAEALGRIRDIRALEPLERLLPVAQATARAAVVSQVAWVIRELRQLHGLPMPSVHEAHRDLLVALLAIDDNLDQDGIES